MPRPNRNRRLISVYLAESGVTALDRLAKMYGVTRSDAIRMALVEGLPVLESRAEREAKAYTPPTE